MIYSKLILSNVLILFASFFAPVQTSIGEKRKVEDTNKAGVKSKTAKSGPGAKSGGGRKK